MSSSNDLFGPEDFDNLIAAVDSLEIPLDDDSLSSPVAKANQATKNNGEAKSSTPVFEVKGDPLNNTTSELSLDASDYAELEDLSDYSELNFDESDLNDPTFSPTLDFADQTSSNESSSSVAQFSVDDPFSDDSTNNLQQKKSGLAEDSAIDDEDDLIDFYESFLEATNESEKQQAAVTEVDFTQGKVSSGEKPDLFGDDGYEVFDGVAAANEISSLLREDENPTEQNISSAAKSVVSPGEPVNKTPLMSSMEKTQQAANKLKAHLASISAKQQPVQTTTITEEPQHAEAATEELIEGFEDLQQLASSQTNESHTSNVVNFIEPEDVKPETLNQTVVLQHDTAQETSFDEFDGFFDATQEQEPVNVALKEKTSDIDRSDSNSLPVGDLADGPIELSRKTAEISDTLMASFLESTLSSKKKVRLFSLQSFAKKFPRTYFVCTTLLALAGFLYILAIPVLLGVAMFNGFDMLNSPFTDNMVMLLTGLFGISLFLFMSGYKLLDLKFVGPGGITLNHENASELIEKIQQLRKEHKIPKIHEIILTRRHELNVIKLPRFGLPIWSKNVIAIGYPLLQTLPAEYFDVALTRRLLQFNKRKNLLHNWLSFMRRTWTIYAVSLKERKGIIDLMHYCFFAPYASLYRKFAVYVSQKDELLADEKALHCCNDRDLVCTAQMLRITRAMLIQYFWPKLSEELQSNTSAPHYVKPYSQLPGVMNTLLNTKQVDAWFIRLGQEESNPDDPEAPFARRMTTLGQRKVALPKPFVVNAAQHYFGEQYAEMTELLDRLWAEEVQKALFNDNIHSGNIEAELPCYLAIEPA